MQEEQAQALIRQGPMTMPWWNMVSRVRRGELWSMATLEAADNTRAAQILYRGDFEAVRNRWRLPEGLTEGIWELLFEIAVEKSFFGAT